MTTNLKTSIITIACIIFCHLASAQAKLSISGVVTAEKNLPVKSATVFLSGTKSFTATDDEGKFAFKALEPGVYKVVVKLHGYGANWANLMLQKDSDLKVKIHVKAPTPKADTLETSYDRAKKLEILEPNFLGLSDAGLASKILNPEVLNFKEDERKDRLEIVADDFLIIQNRELGYKITYLLKAFVYDRDKKIARYDGDGYFEDLPGGESAKQTWQQRRLHAYKGSLMHFARSVYKGADEPLKEGFLTQRLASEKIDFMLAFSSGSKRISADVISQPVAFDTLVSVIDDSSIALKFKKTMAVTYNPHKVASISKSVVPPGKKESVILVLNCSAIQIAQNEAVFDSRGNFVSNFPFRMLGFWDEMRVGDQLPFDYDPDK